MDENLFDAGVGENFDTDGWEETVILVAIGDVEIADAVLRRAVAALTSDGVEANGS